LAQLEHNMILCHPNRLALCNVVLGVAAFLSVAAVEQAAWAAGLKLPFEEHFLGNTIGPEWTVDVASGNTVRVESGVLEIRAKERSHAHIQRPLEADHVLATFAVQPDSWENWQPMLSFYWDSKNWCKIGWNNTPYVAEMVDGKLTDSVLGTISDRSEGWRYIQKIGMLEIIPPSESARHWQHLGIELGTKTIHYLYSPDGVKWETVRVSRRIGKATGGAPKLLILGKGVTAPPDYPAPDMNNDDADRGEPGVCRIKDVVVTPTAADRLENVLVTTSQSRDEAGQRILNRAEEPSFATMSAVYPAMRFPREVVGVKDHPNDFIVLPDGGVYSTDSYSFFEIGDPPARFGVDGGGLRKRLYTNGSPIVIGEYEHQGLHYEETVFGYAEDFSPDRPAIAYLRMRVTNGTKEPRPARVAYRLADKAGDVLDPRQADKVWTWRLPPGASETLYLSIPYRPTRQTLGTPAAEEFDRRLEQVKRYWHKLLNQGMTIDVPEERVNRAYRAWLAYNFLNVSKKDGRYEPHDGSYCYPHVYGISASLYCRILDEYGYHDDARRYLESLLTFVEPDGQCIINYGLPDGGALLIAIHEHYLATRDSDWVRRIAPTVRRLCDWIVRKRQEARAGQSKDAKCYGLLFEKPYCDYVVGKAYNYISDGYLAVGLAAAGRMFQQVGMNDMATPLLSEARDYKRDILASMDRTTVERDGRKIIPLFPETQADLKVSNDTAAEAAGLICGQLLEENLFSPDSWQADAFVSRIRRGLILGMGQYWGGIDHAYTYGYWHNCLQREKIPEALLGFYGSLAYAMSRETFSSVEVTYIKSGLNYWTMPHLYSGTQQLRLLRNMLVREEEQRLILAQATPRAWLEAGKAVRIQNSSTFFGPVSYTIESHADGRKMSVTLNPPTVSPPQVIELHLRHPKKAPVESVELDGQGQASFTDETIRLDKVAAPCRLDVSFAVKTALP
jgi:hypothetical protein